jgi:hypothetical protein
MSLVGQSLLHWHRHQSIGSEGAAEQLLFVSMLVAARKECKEADKKANRSTQLSN